MKVILVQNLPPNVTEQEIVAALEVYGKLKSFGMCKSTAFVDYKNPEHGVHAVEGIVIVRKWVAHLFFGNSTTKRYRKPSKPSHYDYMFALDTHTDVLKSQKFKLPDTDLTNVEMFKVLDKLYGDKLTAFNRENIFLNGN